ncbi:MULTISPECIES: hypothetical protein [unclassified Microbacterium]|uniref:hypothetical protein n=1 Tax=unclassified Microbacterium TaxID=2609290 RepID=UPI0006FD250A|nr:MULTISPECIES: hypothetical protein [unclassified Microbacterium]KQT74115.1 hypothetical protein ASG45_05815 [Microbacterium sp. Leaf436]MBD8206386.1 hypothetical protein [Microbacterium sp. CFBP 8801]MBD8508418.1 hypothetical protein [Microbacterium sp. CFBP 8790]
MAVEWDEVVEPAGTQYDDFRGTAAADGHGPALTELAEAVGLDLDRYMLVGVQFGHSQLRGRDGLTLFAVDREQLGGLTLAEYSTRHGEIPVTDFLVHELRALDVLSRGLKRFKVQLISRAVPEDVPLRRISRDDLNHDEG